MRSRSRIMQRSRIPGKCFCYLACNPIRCRVGCHADPDNISAIKPYNDEAIKQFEADGWDNEQNPWRQCPGRDYAGRSAIPGWGPCRLTIWRPLIERPQTQA